MEAFILQQYQAAICNCYQKAVICNWTEKFNNCEHLCSQLPSVLSSSGLHATAIPSMVKLWPKNHLGQHMKWPGPAGTCWAWPSSWIIIINNPRDNTRNIYHLWCYIANCTDVQKAFCHSFIHLSMYFRLCHAPLASPKICLHKPGCFLF